MISLTDRPATGRYDLIVVSPHMDDAVYSAGGRILQARRQGKRVLVVTLFGPGNQGQSARAQLRNERAPTVVAGAKANLLDYGARCAEERAALAVLDVDSLWLDQPELIFRKHGPAQLLRLMLPVWPLPWSEAHDTLAGALSALCDAHLAAQGSVSFPLAVGFHPDHRLACDVGRALHARGKYDVEFYEDLPYNHSRPLRALRLWTLGVPAQLSLFAGTADIMRVMFRASRVLRWAIYLPLFFHVTVLASLQRLLSLRDLGPGEPPPTSCAHDIADVIETKVQAMRAYASQTRMFFYDGDAIYPQLRRFGGYLEHSWRFAPAAVRS